MATVNAQSLDEVKAAWKAEVKEELRAELQAGFAEDLRKLRREVDQLRKVLQTPPDDENVNFEEAVAASAVSEEWGREEKLCFSTPKDCLRPRSHLKYR